MNKTAIGRNIYVQLLKHDMTQRDLATRINVTEVTMSRWINGLRQPTAYGLYRIAKVFRVSMEDLMEGIEEIDT